MVSSIVEIPMETWSALISETKEEWRAMKYVLLFIFTINMSVFGQNQRLIRIFDLFMRNEYDSALLFLEKSLHVDPDNPELHFYLGKTWLASKRPALAIAEFQQAFEDKPSDEKVYEHIGKAYEEQGMIPEAIDAYTTAMLCTSPKASIQLKLASLYFNRHDYDGAIEILNNLLETDSIHT